MSTPLLQTKFHVPGSPGREGRQGSVSRPRLMRKLDAALAKRLTLVCAPAGFGKSTILSEWIRERSARREGAAAWLSLDEGDNDAIRFWCYFIAALQSIDAEIGGAMLALLQSPHPPEAEIFLTSLLNEIASHPHRLVIVLDDYHLIHSAEIHKALIFLLDHLPPQLHLILSSRSDPPWPLARWRGKGELTEIRIDDLRFVPDEAAHFLRHIMGLELATAQIDALETRTEGWIAGLQLAALSLQGVDDKERFIAAFSGSNRYIVDYLAEEVLNQQPEEIHSFLLQTSILERMCGSLCDALMQKGDLPTQSGQVILEKLEQANLFLIPLDDERTWYRYHHLLAQVLRHKLRQSHKHTIPQLHQRASVWYAGAGQIEEAVDHALAIPDVEWAAEILERVAMVTLLHRSEVIFMRRLLNRLPAATIHARPHLTLAYAITLALTGQFDAVEQLFAHAAPALGSPDLSNEIAGGITTLRAAIARFSGDMHRALHLSWQALEQLPAEASRLASAAWINIGTVLLAHGDSAGGMQALDKAITLGASGEAGYLALAAIETLATEQARQGKLAQAKQSCEEALALAVRLGLSMLPATGMAQVGIGEVLCEWDEVDEAERLLAQALPRLQRTTEVGLLVRGHIALARIQAARQDRQAALLTLQRGEEWLTQMQITSNNARGWLAAYQAYLWTRTGELSAPRRWAETTVSCWTPDDIPKSTPAVSLDNKTALGCFQLLTRVRLNLAQHRQEPNPNALAAAMQQISRLLAAIEPTGWESYVLEGYLVQALLYQAQGERSSAQVALQRALALAEPEGYRRLFLEEGEPLRHLLIDFQLAQARKMPDELQHRLLAYVQALLAGWETMPMPVQERTAHHESQPYQPLAEPLTERELEILRLVHSGLSNQEIASRLIVTVGTVKKHLNNIFGKLGVNSRTQALVSARALNLL